MRILPASDQALLVELDDLRETLALFQAWQREPLPGVDEIVPAARTLLVAYRPSAVPAETTATRPLGRASHDTTTARNARLSSW